MKKIINVTPHSLTFQNKEGEVYIIEPSGILINARPVESLAGMHNSNIELVKTLFQASPEEEGKLRRIEKENPDAIIVGSIIAAQSFPGRVFAMVPVPGFERVPPDQKRMADWKFTTF